MSVTRVAGQQSVQRAIDPRPPQQTSPARQAPAKLAAQVKAARRFFEQLPTRLQSLMTPIRSSMSSALAGLSRPAKSDAQKLTGLLRSEKMQSETSQLATKAANFDAPQAMQAFRLATGNAGALPDDLQDQGVKDFVEATKQLKTSLEARLGPDHARLAVGILAGQAVADRLSEVAGDTSLGRDCQQALASYSGAQSPAIEQNRAFTVLLIFARHST